MAYPIIVRLGSGLVRIGADQLKKYMKKGATPIKNPTSSQMKQAVTPNKLMKKRRARRGEKHMDRVEAESKGKYTPTQGQPKGYEDIYEGDEVGVNRFRELKDMPDMFDDPMSRFDVKIRKKKGGSIRSKYRGGGVALRGFGKANYSKKDI